jgi:hypothetical protein
LRVSSITQRHIDVIDRRIESHAARIKSLEDTKSKAIGMVIALNGVAFIIWALFTKLLESH